MTSDPRILAIIPCYNEALIIGLLLEQFKALPFAVDTLVIDDGSRDDTAAIAQQYTTVIRFEQNRGLTAGVLAGLSHALEHDYDYCIQIDGDGQHIPAEIAHFIAATRQAPAHMFVGSRYYGQLWPKPFTGRRLAGSVISVLTLLLFGRWIYDPLSGMRMLNRYAMRHFMEHMKTSEPDSAMIPIALKAGLSVREVPVAMQLRTSGISYLKGFNGVRFLLRVIKKMLAIRVGGEHSPLPEDKLDLISS